MNFVEFIRVEVCEPISVKPPVFTGERSGAGWLLDGVGGELAAPTGRNSPVMCRNRPCSFLDWAVFFCAVIGGGDGGVPPRGCCSRAPAARGS